MLEILDITVSYGTREALKNLTLVVEPGEIVGVVGPNGAGKTTLFKTLMGMKSQDRGEIRYNNKAISEIHSREFGYLADQPFQFEFFTPSETLLFERSLKYPELSDERITEMIERLELSEFKDIPLKHLSQGLKKRVSIAAAFMGDPSVLVLDEPLNAIDIQTVIVLKSLLREASLNKAHIVISSHVLNFFDGLIQKVAFLEQGSIRHVSTGDAIDAEEIYKSLFMPQ